MTSPTGGGSEHVSRYRALGEFDNLIRAARDAKRALKELREEEAKLNSQSLADDKKLTASKQERAKAEKSSSDATQRALERLKQSGIATKAGEDTGVAFNKAVGKGIEKDSKSGSNRQFLDAATSALKQAFNNAGTASGVTFTDNFGRSLNRNFGRVAKTEVDRTLSTLKDRVGTVGQDTGLRYVQGFATKIRDLNIILKNLGFDKLDLDVGIDDAKQSIKAVEFELNRLSHTTTEPFIRIDTNRALKNLREIQKLFKDEVAEDIIKESERIREELIKIDNLPSGRSFKFWALTALSDMSRVFEEAERGTSVFERLRRAAAGGSGGGGNFLRSFVSGFDDFSESSSNLLQRLSRVSGELYRMPGLIAVIVSALPALISGIGALAGGALGLASGIGAAAGVFAAFPGIIAASISVVGGLAGTFGDLGEAMKAAQKAEAQEAEAKEQARLGTEKALTAQQKYNIIMKQLSPDTRKVTEALIDFSKKWKDVQQVVGNNFFKEVSDQTDRLNQLLPIAQNYFGTAATALGKVADEGIRMITSGPWKRDFAIIAKNNTEIISNMGGAGLGLANVFRNIAVAAGPFTTWLTRGLKEGAKSFADWSAQARSNGTITDFLDETRESLQSLWQIFKNLGNVVNSFFQSTVDEGQRYLSTLEDITGHWADVAKAQEEANSPLREWMTNIRPVLAALGALIGDLSRGLAKMASDQSSIKTMIDLLNTLRTEVLPPIFKILQELNESGIAVTVTQALGDMLEAIANFLDSGATSALTVFVTVLANFFELLFNIASLPGVSNVLGSVAAAIAALAAVSIVARFTGLFRLWDFFTWMVRNKGNLAGAFSDAARGVAGLPTNGETAVPRTVPSSVANPVGGIGSEVIGDQARSIERTGTAAGTAAPKVGLFSRAVAGISVAGGAARSALGGLVGFLGGPWGAALAVAAVGAGLLAHNLAGQKQEAEATKNAFIALKNAYGELSEGNTENVNSLAATDEKFKQIITQADTYGLSLLDVSGALQNQEQNLTRFNEQIDTQIASLSAARDEQIAYAQSQGDTTGAFNEGITAIQKQIDAATEYKNTVNGVASEQQRTNEILQQSISASRSYEERLGGMTQAQVDNAQLANQMGSEIRVLSNALDTMSSATSTATDRSRALSDMIKHETGEMMSANEATENWNTQLLNLKDSVNTNGRSLSVHTREGLRNRDALQAAAKATRDLYLEDIAAGTPMDQVTKKHQARIVELREEARRLKLNKTETENLIRTYGDVPDSVKTVIKTDANGFAQVYADLMKLSVMQKALAEGKSIAEAQRAWNAESSGLYQRYIPPKEGGDRGRGNSRGDGYGAPGFATGGPVWGAGTRTSDSIRAWLSNGEFVQPTDAVEHYGMGVMEALRKKTLDKSVIQEALPGESNNTASYATGGAAHSNNCVSCESGGHKFARGGGVGSSWPFIVDPRNTKIDKNWATQFGGIGGEGGPGGYRWQMQVLRQRFPGLPLISGYRPGSRTLSGNRSYHSLGRAVDLPPRRDVAAWIRANYGARTKELITPFNDLNIHNGRPHRYTGAVWNQHNFAGGNAHDHWAFNKGGPVDLMQMLGMNNIMPSTRQQLPTTPRTLSPAASSVVNNDTDNTTSFGDIIINNPTAERGGDSIRNALYRTQLLL